MIFYVVNVLVPGAFGLFQASIVIWVAWNSNPPNWSTFYVLLAISIVVWTMTVTGWRKSKAHALNATRCRRLKAINHRLHELDHYGPATDEERALEIEGAGLMREILAFSAR